MNSIQQAENNRNYQGVLRDWMLADPIQKLRPLLNTQRYMFDPKTHKLVTPRQKTVALDTPWCHSKAFHKKNCTFDHNVVFDHYGIIPPRCQKCWKVVATLDTFDQLLHVEQIQLDTPFPSKCGMEMRVYTPKAYGAYWYTESLEAGRERYEQVKELIKPNVPDGDKVNVILKRGCTEFEFVKGPSPYWTMTPHEEEMYEFLLAYVENPRNQMPQAEFVKNYVRGKWATWAHSRGDMSYQKYNDGQSLYPDYVKYHEGEVEDLKADLAAAQASTYVDSLTTDKSFEFMKIASDFAKEKEVPMGALIHTLGASERNPINPKWFNETPEELKGDHDELT